MRALPHGVLCCWLLFGCAGGPTNPDRTAEPAEWTLLIYIEADTNLERYAVMDLKGIIDAQRSDRIHIVAQVDRSAVDGPESDGYTGKDLPGVANFATTKRLQAKGDRFVELADLGPTNATDPNHLRDFIAWGVKAFPAKRTVLAFMDHGAAWDGWGHDESAGDKHLNLKDLGTALEQGRSAAGIGPFDVILFESCLMSSLEALRILEPHARYVVASEEIAYVGGGQYWKASLSGLSARLDQNPLDFAKSYVDAWKGYFDNHKSARTKAFGEGFTVSVTDAQKIPDVVRAADDLCDALVARMESDPSAWMRVAVARNRAEEYGGHDANGYQCRDLHNFAQGLAGLGPEVDRTRDALLRSIEAALLHHPRGVKRARGYGISALFPSNQRIYQEARFREAGAHEGSIAASPKWPGMVSTFYEHQSRDRKPPTIGRIESSKRTLRVGEPIQLQTTLEADDIKECHLMLLDHWGEKFVVLGMFPIDLKQGKIQCTFDGTWPMVKIPWGMVAAHMRACVTGSQRIDDRTYLVTVPARYRSPGAKAERKISVFFSTTQDPDGRFQSGSFLYAYEFTPFGAVQVEMEKDGELKTSVLVMDKSGATEEVAMTGGEGFKLGEEPLELIQTPLAFWRPKVGFRITDLSDNTVLEVTEVNLIKELSFGRLSEFGPIRSGPKTQCPQGECGGRERETVLCKDISKFERCPDPAKCPGVTNPEKLDAEKRSVFQSTTHTHHVLFEHTIHCDYYVNEQGPVIHALGGPIWRPENEADWRAYECRQCGQCFDLLPKDAKKVHQDQSVEATHCPGHWPGRDHPHLTHWKFDSKLPKRHARSDHRTYSEENK